MKILIILLLTSFILFVIVVTYCKYDYQNYIKKYANKYSIDEINTIIQKYKKILEQDTQNNRYYSDDILCYIELLEQALKYKLSKKN